MPVYEILVLMENCYNHSLNMHTQLSNGVRDLSSSPSADHCHNLVCVSRKGSEASGQMHRLP